MTSTIFDFHDPYDAYTWGEALFERRDYYGAARVLQRLVDTYPEERAGDLASARELLARSYFHSAQVERAAQVARDQLANRPDDVYAALLLTRSLERMSRHDEAAAARRLAEALGA